METIINNIFITGDLHVGKSTLINRLIRYFHINIGGFKTLRYYKQKQLIAFYMKNLNSNCKTEEYPFIGYLEKQSWVAVPDTFEKLGVPILQDCLKNRPDLIIMDELGFFENNADKFQNMVKLCLDSVIPVLGVLKKADTTFLNSIKERKDIDLITMTSDNREIVTKTVRLLLERYLIGVTWTKNSNQ